MKHLLIAASLSGALLADAIILEEIHNRKYRRIQEY